MRALCFTPTCWLRAGYIVAMGVVLIAVVLGFVVRSDSIEEMRSDAYLVNTAGRQRMLSQRISAKSAALVEAIRRNDPRAIDRAAAVLHESSDDWRDAQLQLVEHYTTGEGETGFESALEIVTLFEKMSPAHSSVLKDVGELLSAVSGNARRGGDGDAETGAFLAARIARNADEFLPIMHATVGAIERRANAKLDGHRKAQAVLAGITLAMILLACLLVFEPIVRWQAVLTEQLRVAAEAAEEGSRAKTTFLANMSHEIRTPVTAIVGYSKLIAGDPNPTSEELSAWSRTVETNARHLLDLINDILDVSKVEAGRMAVECVETNPAVVVEEVVSLLRLQASAKSIDLCTQYDTPIPDLIRTDPVRVRQVLLNLVGNAVKFTRKGGVTIRLSCDRENERVVFRVEDTGVGLTPRQLEKIGKCEAFTQADSSTTRQFGGTGLGLKLCKTLLDLLDGKLEIKSSEGRGSVFIVSIPTGDLEMRSFRVPDPVPGVPGLASQARAAEVASLDGMRVLLVEDGADNRRLFERFLIAAGADFRCVENGALAVEMFREPDGWRPDIVLMDMQMPVLDGYGATRRLRKMGVEIPVVALTANAMSTGRRACIDAGCDDYLSKPVVREELISRCVAWVSTHERDAA